QRRTGAAFHFGATFPKEQFRLDGERKIYERDADSGHRIRFHFCPNCRHSQSSGLRGGSGGIRHLRLSAALRLDLGGLDASLARPPAKNGVSSAESAIGHMTQETMRKTPDLHRPQAKHLGRDPEKFIERPMTKRVLSAALVAAGTGVCGTSIAAAADLSVRK